jgi:ABC-type Fe3+/spermidine/putrescine transport system ATPase subunit
MTSFLALDGLDKRFGELHVLDRISLGVDEGEILALLGPSGSGKTTLLRLLAGFELPDRGSIRVGGEEVTGLPPARRRFGMVFQHYALFPHLTVGENVAFGLEGRGADRAAIRDRVGQALAQVDLAGFEERSISQLSGGQQQRVALARALAPEPRVLLLDEPLSNLDPTLRERTRRELREAIESVGITTVFVTHEQEEAFDLGGRVAVLHDGRLDQVGTPEELYETPVTRFVAGFIGRNNLLPATVAEGGVQVGDRGANGPRWPLPEAAGLEIGEAVELAVRPERLELVAPDTAGALTGSIHERRYAGPVTWYGVTLDDGGEIEVLGAPDAGALGVRVGVRPAVSGPPMSCFDRSSSETVGESGDG